MKKSIILTLTALVSSAILTGCASTQVALQRSTPAAVITIIGNPDVPWYSEDPEENSDSGLLTNIVNNAVNSQNPELLTAIDRLDYADDSIRHILPEIAGCEILEKGSVVGTDTYKHLHASYFNTLSATKKATDYKDLSTIGAKNARMLMKEIGAKSLIVMDFSFYKLRINKKAGKECAALAFMKIKVLDERGKEIINEEYTAQTKPIKIYSDGYDKDELVALFPEAIDNVIQQFAVKHSGIYNADTDTSESEAASEDLSQYAVQIKMPAKPAATSE